MSLRTSGASVKGRDAKPQRLILGFPSRVFITGIIALFTAAASWWLMAGSAAIHCDSLAPLTVLATLAAFLISVCFRQMGRHPQPRSRWFLLGCMIVAGATLFFDFRFVREYRDFCDQLRQGIQQSMPAPKP